MRRSDIAAATEALNPGDRRLLRLLRRSTIAPTEREMAARLGIQKTTVRWRLAKLEAAGMIERRRPRGRTVSRGVTVTTRGKRA